MSIPHVDHGIAHIDRAVVPASPPVAFECLVDLAEVLEQRQDVRIEDWPDDGLRVEGASFWAVHQAVPTAGHPVSYRVTAIEPPNLLDLQATSDLYEADHRVLVAPATGGGAEIAWRVTLTAERATTRQLLADAALLATVTLQEVDTIDEVGARARVLSPSITDTGYH